MSNKIETIKNNLIEVKTNISKAENEAGRPTGSTTLIAVTKTHPADILKITAELGVTDIGENYIQEAADKFEELGWVENSPVKKHFIGHLQSNKTKKAVKYFDIIESIDSIKLLEVINHYAEAEGKIIEGMLQVNSSAEDQKGGFSETEIEEALYIAKSLNNVTINGIMTIGSVFGQKNDFFLMKNLFEQLQSLTKYDIIIKNLSMGMSHDYKDAITYGATHVRIGSNLFGKRS